MTRFKQCEMLFLSGAIEVCWLPEKLAIQGATIKLKDYGDELIIITKVYHGIVKTLADLGEQRKADFPSIGL